MKPDDALAQAQALGLSEAMVQQIKAAIPPRRNYVVFAVDDDGNLGDRWICKMNESEASTARRKSKVKSQKSKVLWNGLFRDFKWLPYLRRSVLVSSLKSLGSREF